MAVAPSNKREAVTTTKKSTHPTYAQMVKEAIVALKERTGSSHYAIAKHIQDNHQLPINFKKMLLVQLKKLVANGKLTKVKNSFKLAAADTKKKTTSTGVKKTVASPKAKAATKVVAKAKAVKKTTTPVKKKKTVAKKPKSIKSPVKKVVAAKKAKK